MPADEAHSNAPLTLLAPISGIVVPLDQVPDPVFAGASLGPGIALDPLGDTLLAPCAGEIIQCARTAHAVTIRSAQGAEILIHLGLDTVTLNGKGIDLLVEVGQRVTAGEALCRFDPDALACQVTSLITPLVITNAEPWHIETLASGVVAAQAPLLRLTAVQGSAAHAEAGRPLNADEAEALPMREAQTQLALAAGLHARPAARLRDIAHHYQCHLVLHTAHAHAAVNSLTAMLGLELVQGDTVTLRVEGERADEALAAALAVLETPEAEVPGQTPPTTGRQVPTVPAEADSTHTLDGLIASPGLALGRLVRYMPALPEVARDGRSPAEESVQLDAALAALGDELQQALRTAHNNRQEAEASIFAAHLAWLEDPALREQAGRHITDGRSAGYAWRETLQGEIDRLAASRNAVLAERTADLRDLQRRIMQHLSVAPPARIDLPAGAIVVAEELTPSELVALDQANPAGLCLALGGTTSHVAILARARGLPCLVAMGETLLAAQPSGDVILDAQHGVLELAATDARRQQVEAQLKHDRQRAAAELEAAQTVAVTRDGISIEVGANIASSDEAQLAQAHGADGIGLLRSEFLFLDRREAPSEAQQHSDYQAVLAAMPGKPIIIRTLDVGADKTLDYLPLPAVPNPALGTRGVRLMARHGALLDIQLRALLSVTPIEQLHIMVPMISDAAELRQVHDRMTVLATEMGLTTLPALGAMIEVPSAALCAARLAEVADFLSIGTNDLTQYTLAMDREDPLLAARADVLHPGVLRLIRMTVEGAAGRHCRVGVCGAAAGDPEAWAALVALGVDELSVEPARVPAIKAAIRRLDRGALAERLDEWLALDDAVAVRRHLRQWLNDQHVSVACEQ